MPTKAKKIMDVYIACVYVKHMSFPHRYANYVKFIKQNGFFKYGNAEFYIDGTIKIDNTKYNIKDEKLFKSPFQLTLEIDAGKFGGLYGKKEIVVNTIWDSDVFYELIKNLYGIAWKD